MYNMVINITNGNYKWETNWGLTIQAKKKAINVEVEYEYDREGIKRIYLFATKVNNKWFEYNGLILEEINPD